jgi:hypothetical protein
MHQLVAYHPAGITTFIMLAMLTRLAALACYQARSLRIHHPLQHLL